MSPYIFAIAALAVVAHSQAPGYPHGGGICNTIDDCSLGGDCVAARCVCDAWWTGADCSLLNLQRPRLASAAGTCGPQFDSYYSWGGRSIKGADGRYHLFASFMCRHATLSQWTTVSASAHFVSDEADGAFEWFEGDCDGKGVCTPIVIPWSHNTVIATNAGDQSPRFLLAHIGDGVVNPSQWSPCYNRSDVHTVPVGLSAPTVDAFARGVGSMADPGDTTYFATSDALAGPWVRALNNSGVIINNTGSWSSEGFVGNPAPLVLPNGSVRLYFTARNCPAGHGALNGNCIAVAQAETWAGPYQMYAPRPATYPESEDPFAFIDHRGNYHLLTNVNTGHQRCPAGEPCGGHAWSRDGLVFTDLIIGAFGPVVTLSNGSTWRNAFVERPLITFADDGVTPLAFHVGMGRSAYDDCCNWVQLFCTNGSDPTCGPTRAAPPVLAKLVNGGQCLIIFNASSFPCSGGGPSAGCPVVMGDCADPSALWNLAASDGSEAPVVSHAISGVGLNVDCDDTAPHTVVKALASSHTDTAVSDGRVSVLGGRACINTGQGPPRTPCGPAGEIFLPTQIQLVACDDVTAQGWSVEVQ